MGAQRPVAPARLLRVLAVIGLVPAAVLALDLSAPEADAPSAPGPTRTSDRALPTGSPRSDGSVAAYVDRALVVMERHGLHVDDGWPAVVRSVRARAALEARIADTYPALTVALRHAGGPTSRLVPPDEAESFSRGAPEPLPQFETTDGVTTIVMPSLSARAQSAGPSWADAVGTLLSVADERTTCGWVLDLRATGGDYPWWGLAGLASLVDDGPLLGSMDRDGVVTPVMLSGSTIHAGQTTIAAAGPAARKVHQPLAVLTSSDTSGAGAALAVALGTDRPRTRSFGLLATGLELSESFPLPDSALVVLPTARIVARDREPIDHAVQSVVPTRAQDADDAADAWLRTECPRDR